MGYNFIECNREQIYLLPPSMRDWLPEGDLSWFIIDAVNKMDLSEFYRKYRPDGRGQAAFEPTMMVSLLLYAYSNGVRSSRTIEKLCERDISYRVISANTAPDHSTICRFRQENEEKVTGLFVEVLKLCAKAGLVKVGVVSLDGTKIKANASLSSNREYEHIKEEVKNMLSEAEAKDKEEDVLYGKDKRGDELPKELRNRKSRLARLEECKKLLEAEAKETALKQEEKIKTRQAEEAETGKKKRGRKPKAPKAEPEKETKANTTDPDSRIMKTRSGYVQGYNAQAAVTEEQIIIAAELTQEANDVKQLHPMIEKAQESLKAIGKNNERQRIKALTADAGYFSEGNISKAIEKTPELYIAVSKDWKQRKTIGENSAPRGRIPKDMDTSERMERKLITKRGKAIYKKRGQTVEPVFGQIKAIRNSDRFMRRGEEACASEWKLLCATHNLLKLWRRSVQNKQREQIKSRIWS